MGTLARGSGSLLTDPDPEKIRAHFKAKKKTSTDKLTSVTDAVERFIPDGCYLASGGFGSNRIATALLHEIVRQGKRDLGVAGHTMTHDFQILCAGECISRCDAAYIVGLEARGLSRNARKQIESGKIELCEWTNGALAWRLRAAAMGVSFIPARTMLGTDTFSHSAAIEIKCPFTGQTYAALPALYPDVALIHVHRADVTGNAQIDGLTVADIELSQAAKYVVISTEKIVSEAEMRRHPDRTQIPGLLVDAVVEVPYGAYPANMPGLYYSDEAHLAAWLEAEEDSSAFKDFLQKYIFTPQNHAEYLDLCGGAERLEELRRLELFEKQL